MPLLQTDYRNVAYLKNGSLTQQAAYRALKVVGVFQTLASYDPILTGTIPLGINLPESDLDIVCQAIDLEAFASLMRKTYSAYPEFSILKKTVKNIPSLVTRFSCCGFPFEIFAQDRPVESQHAYLHLLVEARLLALGGEETLQGIRVLRQAGLKTEPAFCAYFRFPGDPYVALLKLGELSDEELRQTLGLG